MMQSLLISITDRVGDPISEFGNPDAKFYSVNSTLLATGYTRTVVGERGAYIEFALEHMCMENLHIPPDQKWRLQSEVSYYIGHRSRDNANVKVYEQRRMVGYADYKVGMFYIAPEDVVVKYKNLASLTSEIIYLQNGKQGEPTVHSALLICPSQSNPMLT